MKKQNIKSKEGFTIIEVVLVLAIAGLIFLMVFIALPTLQRSQKDTRRQSDFARFLSQVQAYQKNNRSKLPDGQNEWYNKGAVDRKDFVKKYLEVNDDEFKDPDGEDYDVKVEDCISSSGKECSGSGYRGVHSNEFPNGHQLIVVKNAVCDGEKAVGSTGSRKVALLYKYENGGVYCGNN